MNLWTISFSVKLHMNMVFCIRATNTFFFSKHDNLELSSIDSYLPHFTNEDQTCTVRYKKGTRKIVAWKLKKKGL
jgi:hypothetical protein